MNLTITLDNLDESIRKLKELAELIRQFPKDVAIESMDSIGYSDTGVSYGEGENIVYASGKEIAFEEFGAGYWADTTSLTLSDGGNIATYPGAWSEDHARTFQRHRESGEPTTSYKYNKLPQHKMQREAERLRNNTEQKAREYFK